MCKYIGLDTQIAKTGNIFYDRAKIYCHQFANTIEFQTITITDIPF
jgi:hypothetical protein